MQLKELISKGKIDEDTMKQVQDLIQDKTSSLKQLAGSSAAGGVLAGSGEKLSQLFQNVPGAQEVCSHIHSFLVHPANSPLTHTRRSKKHHTSLTSGA